MGYGEVGGGGSVDWLVVHGGNLGISYGSDPHPPKATGKFIVFIGNEAPRVLPLTTRIRIVWVDAPGTATEQNITALAQTIADQYARQLRPTVNQDESV
jgi:hypothetical protein